MPLDPMSPDADRLVQDVAGYLNFSSGSSDPRFLQAINALFGGIASAATAEAPQAAWRALGQQLRAGLERLRGRNEAFHRTDQADAVVRLVFDEVLPAYRHFHRDLLFHQTEESLFQPLFIGRACEAVLAAGSPWEETDRVVGQAIRRLNSFIGYRPVAVLRTSQKMQPYEHEWVAPIPLYIRNAGVAWGRYHELIALCLEIFRATDPELLRQAWFHPDMLDELSVDPRAYDFDHPVNRRPNYHFGSWDQHLIDNRGYYRRFVLQQVTLEGLWSRVQKRSDLPRDEVLFEAAATLVCTMLMGSGITGDGPEAHDSATTLGTLVVRIAAYRDAFYEQLLGRLTGPHADRLRAEAQTLRQPFGGARQHLNQCLSRRRAEQLQHVQLARIFARMGYPEAAIEQAHIVPVAAARMRSEIDCRLTAAHREIDRGRLAQAASLVEEIEDWLHRAIECGAMVDPWNILGFGGQFSRFPAVEDSVHDERIDELVELVDEIFTLSARLQSKAAAAGDGPLGTRLSIDMQRVARWWDQFASAEVAGMAGISGHEAWDSSLQVAGALAVWHRAGTAAGDVAFWREHAEEFRSPKAYAALVEALLEQHDLVAAMALLVHWLSQVEEIPLAEGKHSFYGSAIRWMHQLWGTSPSPWRAHSQSAIEPDRRWILARKFLDYLEANAESFWQVPQFELGGPGAAPGDLHETHPSVEVEEDVEEEADDSEDLFGAAYENMIYRDTTDDGFEGEMLEGVTPSTDFELSEESERIGERLAFLGTVVRLWQMAAVASFSPADASPDRDAALLGFSAQAAQWQEKLGALLAAVQQYRIAPPRGTHASLVEFDQRRAIKEMLVERIMSACVETADAARLLPTLVDRDPPDAPGKNWEALSQRVLRALYRGQIEFARGVWPRLRRALAEQPLLYLPLTRGGNPQRIVQSRNVQRVLRRLLVALPRLGLIQETGELLQTIQRMERNHPAGATAITEFDQLFEIAARGILQCVVVSSEQWSPPGSRGRAGKPLSDRALIELLEQPIEALLKRWLKHSRNVRVSVLEAIADDAPWQGLREFVERYGHDLFSQRFLNYGNLRAILHQGADAYLRSLEEEADDEGRPRLLDDLDRVTPRADAVRWLELCLEAIVENYSEYLDYNSTTTQSDRGEMLYVLLDFLRVEASYDRVAWNIKPVLLAHEVLLRCGRTKAAGRWREAVAERTATYADDQLGRFDRLSAQYGVRLRSVADRLGERFVQPLDVDRLCALVRPAVEEVLAGRKKTSFAALKRAIKQFTAEPGGVGFDLPPWLDALDREVQRVQSEMPDDDDASLLAPPLAQMRLPLEEFQRQIVDWD
jgi:hypothetical protein